MILEDNITFRKLKESDLPLMCRWHNNYHVAVWWQNWRPKLEQVEKKYLARIMGEEPIEAFIIQFNGIDIGFIQTYLINDFPDYTKWVDIKEKAAGMDLFIGEKAYIHIGLGPLIMQKFLYFYVFKMYKVDSCIVGPEPANKAAIRAYEKAGFKYLKTIQIPKEEEPEYLMRITPEELGI